MSADLAAANGAEKAVHPNRERPDERILAEHYRIIKRVWPADPRCTCASAARRSGRCDDCVGFIRVGTALPERTAETTIRRGVGGNDRRRAAAPGAIRFLDDFESPGPIGYHR